jgi:hypothetical protein
MDTDEKKRKWPHTYGYNRGSESYVRERFCFIVYY